VTALAAFKYAETLERTQSPGEGDFDKITAFDVWYGKVSHETFKPIRDENALQKLLLLSQSHVVQDVYKKKVSVVAENILRSMNPGTEGNEAHWKRFP
jgi:hypothetical protein